MTVENKNKCEEFLSKANDILAEGINKNNQDLINKAKNLYKEILLDFPNNPEANHNLGVIFNRQKLYDQAIPYLNISCGGDILVAQFFISRATSKFHLKDLSGALDDINKAEKLEPENMKVILNKGIILRALNDEENAFPYIYKYYDNNQNDAQAINRVAYHYLILENHNEAQKYLKKVLKIAPNHYESTMNYANSCKRTHHMKEAEKYFKKALKLNPNNLLIYMDYGALLQERNQPENAIKLYKKSLELLGKNVNILHNIGSAYSEIGSEEAVKYFRDALQLKPDNYKSFKSLSYTRKLKKDDKILKSMEEKFYDESLSDFEKSEIGHGLIFAYDHLKLYKKSSEFLHSANKYSRKTINYNYNVEIQVNFAERIKKTFSNDLFNKMPESNNKKKFSPIFITGMPRSGTSLVEQIIINHPKIYGGGELPYFGKLCSSIKGFPEYLNSANQELFNTLSDEYCNYLYDLLDIKEESIITDKMPYNFWHIGLIKKVFPDSKVIICNRDLRDVITSLYLLKLREGHPFIYSQKELTNYTNSFYDLTKYWINLLKKNLYIFDYENFIENQESEGRKIFEYLNLEFKKKFLKIEKNNTAVRTASNFQVKKKINKDSINRWKNYESELSEIFNNLSGFKL